VAIRDSQDCLIFEVPTLGTGLIRDTQDCLIFEVPTLGTGLIRDTQDCLLFEIPVSPVTISYPLTPPTQLGPQECSLIMASSVGESVSPFSGNQEEQQWPAQWFELEISLPPMMRAASLAIRNADKRYTAELWYTFLAALGGKYGTFLMGDPNAKSPAGVATGTPLTSGTSGVAPNNIITTNGWTASVTGILLAGDYIQVTPTGGPQRIYKNLFDANSDAGGNASLTVFPMLHEAIGSGISIVTANPQGTFRLSENLSKVQIDRARTYGISFKAKEAF
jgi:hypothetical protein